MRSTSRNIALALAAALVSSPAFAQLPSSPPGAGRTTGMHDNRPAPLSAPGPVQMLGEARAALARQDARHAATLVEQAQSRLLTDDVARGAQPGQRHEAITILDTARGALHRGDVAAALSAIDAARARL